MKISGRCSAMLSCAAAAALALPLFAAAQAAGVLDAQQAGKLLPPAVYFDGQSASTQLRNATGVRFADGQLALAVLVDSSGYSGAVAQKYQGYLLAQVPLDFGGHRLPAGAYGMGIVHGELHIMDIGDHDLLRTAATHDAAMHRPVPLQIVAGTTPDTYRLCFGRECILFRRAK